MRKLIVAVLFSSLAVTGSAEAKGCLKGAAVGAIAGHYMHHHAILGAVAGCWVGHHMAAKKEQEEKAHRQQEQQQGAPQAQHI